MRTDAEEGADYEMKLEVIPIPGVRNVDAAKDFYTRQVGFATGPPAESGVQHGGQAAFPW